MTKIKKTLGSRNGYVLTSFEEGQAEKYFTECFTHSDKEVDRLTGSAATFDHDTVVNYYNRIVNDPDRSDFMIIDPEGKFIGESVINEIDWDAKSANFRIVIFDSKNCSQGIGSWAVQLTRDFAFEELKLHRLELDVFSFNERAQKAYKKAGFQVEGVRRDAILDGDGYADDIMMSILEDEWRALKDE